jgi:hypothetical protein
MPSNCRLWLKVFDVTILSICVFANKGCAAAQHELCLFLVGSGGMQVVLTVFSVSNYVPSG